MKKGILALSLMMLFTVFSASAWCDSLIIWNGGWTSNSYDFGTVLTGTRVCQSVLWTNHKDGQLQCDSNGCVYKPLPTRSVSFTGYSVSPTSATVPAYGSVNLNICATASDGDYTGNVTAVVSPAFEDGSTTNAATYALYSVKAAHNMVASFVTQKTISASISGTNGIITPATVYTNYGQNNGFNFVNNTEFGLYS